MNAFNREEKKKKQKFKDARQTFKKRRNRK